VSFLSIKQDDQQITQSLPVKVIPTFRSYRAS